MGNVLRCENCKYYESYGDAMNPRTDGQCQLMRMTPAGQLCINVEESDYCSHFVKCKQQEDVEEVIKAVETIKIFCKNCNMCHGCMFRNREWGKRCLLNEDVPAFWHYYKGGET